MKESTLSRKQFIKKMALGSACLMSQCLPNMAFASTMTSGKTGVGNNNGNGGLPNIILINTDDLGYGDLGCYGSQAIKTPNIDHLAETGVRFTDFHSCDSVCSPSRAGLLTGRYPVRMKLDAPLNAENIPLKKNLVIKFGHLMGSLGFVDLATEDGATGIDQKEITIAEALKEKNYRTGMVGKWHLGDYAVNPKHNPLNHGFDFYFGVPHSNDMAPFPLYRGRDQLEAEVADQSRLTGLYTEEALGFIKKSQGSPFFLYFAHTFPHRPLYASEQFKGKSEGGLFGDTVEEIDWSVGEILRTLKETGKDRNTLIMFTSDNGPWYQGSPGQFRGRKGQSYEGGHRVPFIANWQGKIRPGSVCDAAAMNIDIFPTLMNLTGLANPKDRIIDGRDISKLMFNQTDQSPHDAFYFYHHGDLEGIRMGKWKYIRTINHYVWPAPVNKKRGGMSVYTTGPLPMLFNLDLDPGEAYNVATKYPEVGNKMLQQLQNWESSIADNREGWLQ